ncbi:dihydroxyacetone kinase subunit DhaK [Paramixta manurensis]|uniref:Dihydroxyacetone kinase subunit DhaK n=1 Tax=Paramixta manurensis TaxID=2740817 RepID=A0A6M8UE09_9GAMM|nr:dihydroxyacetone kinase subunit DhaK [Erwiniaceae bacterium PD-1]
MKKFINQPSDYVTEMLEGIYLAHPRQLRYVNDDVHCLVAARQVSGKVAIVTGGGSGHLPLFLGYVGEGMLDGCAVGDVFQSPSAEQILNVTKAVDRGAGVLYLFGNYTGDLINFGMAAELAEFDDITTRTVVGADDVGSAPAERHDKRRGVAGIFFQYKVAGAAAAQGLALDEVVRLAEKTGAATKSLGVALTPCIIPEVGKPAFSVAEGVMEVGMGIHGEPGIAQEAQADANIVVDRLLPILLAELTFAPGDSVAVLINGLGATPQDELYILYRHIHRRLAEQGIQVFHVWCGEFATAMEMTGFSLSLCRVDAELRGYLAQPAHTPFFTQFAITEGEHGNPS